MQASLTNNIIGKPFVELDSVESTNNYAMQLVKTGKAYHGNAFFAHNQTAGKGQRNKQWLSTSGENIILSVIIDAKPLLLSKQFFLNVIVALAVHELFNNYATNSTKIKWPNDIYYNDRKAAGILIENIIIGSDWQFAVVGIGININQVKFDEALKNPVSLKNITGKNYNVIELAKELCALLQQRFLELLNNDFASLMKVYNDKPV